MASAFNAKLSLYGQWTYRVAWILEIVAASIGLTAGLLLGYQAYLQSLGTEMAIGSFELILSSLPFVIVSLAELTKIPIATLLFAASWLWKPILAVLLALLAFITFETVFMGLERAASNRKLKYEAIAARKADAEIALNAVGQSFNRVLDRTEASAVRAELERLNAVADADLQQKQADISRVQVQADQLKSRNPQIAALQRQISAKTTEQTALLERKNRDIELRGGQFERQRDSYQPRIEEARRNNDLASARRYEEEHSRLVNPVPGIERQFAADIQRLDEELRGLRDDLRRLELNDSETEAQERQRLQERRTSLEDELRKAEQAWQNQPNALLNELEQAQGRDAARASEATALRARASELQAQIADAEKERVLAAKTDQLRRFAAMLHGTAPELIEDKEAYFVIMLWFGSLSALAALAGPLTAIVALGLQRSAEVREARAGRQLSDFLRRWLIRWRYKRVKKVPVRVEVPVEKVVTQTVEVPVEKLVKEILYVPVLTDDPEVVRKALIKDLPAEFADFITTKLKEQARASAA